MRHSSKVLCLALVLLAQHTPGQASAGAVEALVAKLRPALVGLTFATTEPDAAPDSRAAKLNELLRSSAVPVAPPVQPASGTGTLISPDGLVLTTGSSRARQGEIVVRTEAGASFKGEIVAVDDASGLMLLKIPASGLPHVQLAPVAAPEPGEPVLGVGRNSAAAEPAIAVAQGSIAAPAGPERPAVPHIHASYATAPGMGGGPMVRLKTGEIIGFNALRHVPRDKPETTFAIPVAEFLRIEADLKAHGRVRRAAVGITAAMLSPAFVSAAGLTSEQAVLVADVRPGGPAHAAGVQRGDVIGRVADTRVASPSEFHRAIGLNKPGDEIKLTIYRKARWLEVTVRAEETKPPGLAAER